MENPMQAAQESAQPSLSSDVTLYRGELEIGTLLPFKVYRWTQAGGSSRDHAHDYFQIWYVVKGSFQHTIDRKTYQMMKGNLFVIPPYAVHRVDLIPDQEMEIIGCEFLPHFINEHFQRPNEGTDRFDYSYLEQFMVSEDELIPKVTLLGEADAEVTRLLSEMLAEFQQGEHYYELVLKANLLKLLSIIIRQMTKQRGGGSEEEDRMEKFRGLMMGALNYIHEHYPEELRLEGLCRQFNLSKSYFCALFKRYTGKTFNDYLIDLRIRKAAEMLLNTDSTITEIGYGVGFNDIAYFSRIFKRHTGVSPSQFKRNARSVHSHSTHQAKP
ncbi:helix-turn-helix domain-containing protein [Paenibacillus assamensis]|uniref:helix-turn-helix domain-containing protein n=1 Tax=Paenibacillus assamensis TaxID=311244 RepID=UPI00040CDA79|nr:helix-turn-helix domain-containing protein [Paenibacillus assamensis]